MSLLALPLPLPLPPNHRTPRQAELLTPLRSPSTLARYPVAPRCRRMSSRFHHLLLLLPPLIYSLLIPLPRPAAGAFTVGVNYGTVANNLPPPSTVAAFLQQKTSIDRIKLFDANPDILRAFAGTNISVTVSTTNGDVSALAKLPAAQAWVAANVAPFYPQTRISRIAVGNEVLATSDRTLVASLLRAMKCLHAALKLAGITDVEVSTPHSLGILSVSQPPSSGRFRRGYDRKVFAPLLDFHRRTNSSFLVNPYPYFGFSDETLDYAIFKPNPGIVDSITGLRYTNMFDAQMDAVYSAMKRVGYADVRLVVAETGWPSAGELGQIGVSLEDAFSYNQNLVTHVNSGAGTPLMPNRTFETYIFSLFNENLKPTIPEQNFGLFRPDLTPVYDVGVLREPQGAAQPPAAEGPAGRMRCVPKPDASDAALQKNLDFACGVVVCEAIQVGGPCYNPNTVRSHASYAMNAYFLTQGGLDSECDFSGTGMIVSGGAGDLACTGTG